MPLPLLRPHCLSNSGKSTTARRMMRPRRARCSCQLLSKLALLSGWQSCVTVFVEVVPCEVARNTRVIRPRTAPCPAGMCRRRWSLRLGVSASLRCYCCRYVCMFEVCLSIQHSRLRCFPLLPSAVGSAEVVAAPATAAANALGPGLARPPWAAPWQDRTALGAQ